MARILFVTGYFPPFAPVGAVRPVKLAKHWAGAGHEVRVLAVRNPDLWRTSGLAGGGAQPPPATNRAGEAVRFATVQPEGFARPVEVAHLPFTPPGLFGRRRDPEAAPAPPRAPAPSPPAAAPDPRPGTSPLARLRALYQALLLTPDRYASWVRDSTPPAVALAREWRPRFLFSSGPPQSSHRLASNIARATGIPWFPELRDLWVGNPYDDKPALVRRYSARMADRALSAATAFVTVTDGFARALSRRYDRPVLTAFNGFDADDYRGLEDPAPLDPDRLTIIHAGVIYAGRRDARPLLEALARMTPQERARIAVHFYHDEGAYVQRLVAELGVGDSVRFHDLVPRRTILGIERQADVLLLCRWNNPAEDTVIPGKLFEYIGARRPILAVGSETGEAADIVRQGGFGLVSSNPDAIATQLRQWLAQKPGRLPDLPAADVDRWERRHQFDAIDAFIAQHAP